VLAFSFWDSDDMTWLDAGDIMGFALVGRKIKHIILKRIIPMLQLLVKSLGPFIFIYENG
jgi:hypothetical protein